MAIAELAADFDDEHDDPAGQAENGSKNPDSWTWIVPSSSKEGEEGAGGSLVDALKQNTSKSTSRYSYQRTSIGPMPGGGGNGARRIQSCGVVGAPKQQRSSKIGAATARGGGKAMLSKNLLQNLYTEVSSNTNSNISTKSGMRRSSSAGPQLLAAPAAATENNNNSIGSLGRLRGTRRSLGVRRSASEGAELAAAAAAATAAATTGPNNSIGSVGRLRGTRTPLGMRRSTSGGAELAAAAAVTGTDLNNSTNSIGIGSSGRSRGTRIPTRTRRASSVDGLGLVDVAAEHQNNRNHNSLGSFGRSHRGTRTRSESGDDSNHSSLGSVGRSSHRRTRTSGIRRNSSLGMPGLEAEAVGTSENSPYRGRRQSVIPNNTKALQEQFVRDFPNDSVPSDRVLTVLYGKNNNSPQQQQVTSEQRDLRTVLKKHPRSAVGRRKSKTFSQLDLEKMMTTVNTNADRDNDIDSVDLSVTELTVEPEWKSWRDWVKIIPSESEAFKARKKQTVKKKSIESPPEERGKKDCDDYVGIDDHYESDESEELLPLSGRSDSWRGYKEPELPHKTKEAAEDEKRRKKKKSNNPSLDVLNIGQEESGKSKSVSSKSRASSSKKKGSNPSLDVLNIGKDESVKSKSVSSKSRTSSSKKKDNNRSLDILNIGQEENVKSKSVSSKSRASSSTKKSSGKPMPTSSRRNYVRSESRSLSPFNNDDSNRKPVAGMRLKLRQKKASGSKSPTRTPTQVQQHSSSQLAASLSSMHSLSPVKSSRRKYKRRASLPSGRCLALDSDEDDLKPKSEGRVLRKKRQSRLKMEKTAKEDRGGRDQTVPSMTSTPLSTPESSVCNFDSSNGHSYSSFVSEKPSSSSSNDVRKQKERKKLRQRTSDGTKKEPKSRPKSGDRYSLSATNTKKKSKQKIDTLDSITKTQTPTSHDETSSQRTSRSHGSEAKSPKDIDNGSAPKKKKKGRRSKSLMLVEKPSLSPKEAGSNDEERLFDELALGINPINESGTGDDDIGLTDVANARNNRSRLTTTTTKQPKASKRSSKSSTKASNKSRNFNNANLVSPKTPKREKRQSAPAILQSPLDQEELFEEVVEEDPGYDLALSDMEDISPMTVGSRVSIRSLYSIQSIQPYIQAPQL